MRFEGGITGQNKLVELGTNFPCEFYSSVRRVNIWGRAHALGNRSKNQRLYFQLYSRANFLEMQFRSVIGKLTADIRGLKMKKRV